MTGGSYHDWRAFWIDPPSIRPDSAFLATVDGHVAGDNSTLALPRRPSWRPARTP